MLSNILEASLRNPSRSDHPAPEPGWHPSIRTERKSIWVSRYERSVTDRQGANCRLQKKKNQSGYGMDKLQESIWHSATFLDNPKHGASQVDHKIINLVQQSMGSWNTALTSGDKHLANIKIKKGIFQGDALSPRVFCVAINPLSYMLRDPGYAYV